ncbi:MAG: radical SAM protein [Desulfobacca sp.]
MTITITRRCNSRCQMCQIWRLKRRAEELSLQEITAFLTDRHFAHLVELDLTGGEPFLRADLPQLVAEITRLADRQLPHLQTLALATNGLSPALVNRVVRELLAIINGRFDLALVCSLDGLGAGHDQSRGVPGAFARQSENIAGLQELTSGPYPFRLGLKTTLLPWNLHELEGLQRFAQDRGMFQIVSPVLFTAERFRNLASQQELSLLPHRRQDLLDLYSRPELAHHYYAWAVVDSLRRGRRRLGCTAAWDHFFVEGDGRIFPCPLLPEFLGRIQTQTLTDILASPRRREMARQAGLRPECSLCLEPGCLRFSQASEGLSYLRYLLGPQPRRRWQLTYLQEGLYKYF